MNLILPASLAVACLGLGGTIAYEALAPIPAIEVASAPPRVETPVSTVAQPAVFYVPPPKEDFAPVNARFAFSPTRQAVTEPSEGGATDLAPPDVTLVGVIIGPQKSVAILKTPGAALAISAAVGQMVEGWQLVRIEAGRVVLHANASDFEIRLKSSPGQAGRRPPGAGNTAPPAGSDGNL